MHRLLFLTDRSERHQQYTLKAAPPEFEVHMHRQPSAAVLDAVLPTVECIISERAQPVSAAMIEQAAKLKLIVRLGALAYDLDLAAAQRQGVRVSVQSILGDILAAEQLLMMILALLRKLGRSLHEANAAAHGATAQRTDETTFAFNWQHYTDLTSLYGKIVAIVGMGDIGSELAKRLKGFGLAGLLYAKRNRLPSAVENELGLHHATLNECAERADVLVSLLPYSAQTDGLLNEAFFGQMKPGALIVHAGSGSVIDEATLVAALQAGKLGGAALDTYEYEPLQADHPLVALARDPHSNVLLTPHTASAHVPDHQADFYGEALRFFSQAPLRHEVKLVP